MRACIKIKLFVPLMVVVKQGLFLKSFMETIDLPEGHEIITMQNYLRELDICHHDGFEVIDESKIKLVDVNLKKEINEIKSMLVEERTTIGNLNMESTKFVLNQLCDGHMTHRYRTYSDRRGRPAISISIDLKA